MTQELRFTALFRNRLQKLHITFITFQVYYDSETTGPAI